MRKTALRPRACAPLVTLHNTRFGGHADADRVAVLALFHDAPESYRRSADAGKILSVRRSGTRMRVWRKWRRTAFCLCCRPIYREGYRTVMKEDAPENRELVRFVKAADKLSALIKCVEERSTGNREFLKAEKTIRQTLLAMQMPEVDCFCRSFYLLMS